VYVIHGSLKELVDLLAIYEDIDSKGEQILLAPEKRDIRGRAHIDLSNDKEKNPEVQGTRLRSSCLYTSH
jgi:hypothetical protein